MGAIGLLLAPAAPAASTSSITAADFGTLPDGTLIQRYTLRNANGMQAQIATYGGILTSLTSPDRNGHYADIVLGHDTLAGYLKSSPYFGALIGRYGNRIAHGKFTLDGQSYTLATNNGPNALHGGVRGFDKVVWSVAKAEVTVRGPELALSYVSPDGEEGYPGTVNVTATYTLTESNELRLEYGATTDKTTVINLTAHSYFNLRGSGDVLGYILQINASRYTPVHESLIPTGELRLVVGTPFDFRIPTPIGSRMGAADAQLKIAKGYDFNWVIDHPYGEKTRQAKVYDPQSGRVLEVLSGEPGVQFYSANALDGSIVGKGDTHYEKHAGFCLEPQHYPDSPNQPKFPSTVLKPGAMYTNVITYRMTAVKDSKHASIAPAQHSTGHPTAR